MLPTLPPGDEDAPACHCRHGYCRKRGAHALLVESAHVPQGSSANSSFVPENIHYSANRSTFVSKGPIMGTSSLSLFRRMSFSYEIDSIFAQEFYNPAGFCFCINPNPESSSDVFEGNTALKAQ